MYIKKPLKYPEVVIQLWGNLHECTMSLEP